MKARLESDIGTIARIVNPLNNKLIIIFNANHSAGLLGSILYTTRRSVADHWSNECEARQVVVEVENVENNLIGRDHPVRCVRSFDFAIDGGTVRATVSAVARP